MLKLEIGNPWVLVLEVIFAQLSIQIFLYQTEVAYGFCHFGGVEVKFNQTNMFRLFQRSDVVVHFRRKWSF